MSRTLVLGATGTVGGRTAVQLVAAGHRVRAASRKATPVPGTAPVRFDWYDESTHAEAIKDIDRILLVAPIGDLDPAAVMLPFLHRARDAGVHRVALVSSSGIPSGGPAQGQVHHALPGLFDEYAVLRPSWFMQNLTGRHAHADSIRREGVIYSATEGARVAFVDADDLAAVAVHALTDEQAPGTDLVVTGPEALGYDDVAALLTELTGRPVVHQRLPVEDLRDRLANVLPPDFATLLAELDRSIATGSEDRVTDTVPRITGRSAHPLRTVLTRELDLP